MARADAIAHPSALRVQSARDTSIAEKGPDHDACLKLIEQHKVCLRAEGFNV